jgi:hypothetical protein
MDLILKIHPTVEDKNNQYRKILEDSLVNPLKSQIQDLENKLGDVYAERDELLSKSKFYEDEAKFLKTKFEKIETENKIMTEQMIKRVKDISRDGNMSYDSNNNNNRSIEQLNKSRVGGNVSVGPVNARVLTKHMLLEIISDIYASKQNYDKKCLESKIPKETMEQHMFTSLNQKYGLKNLIIEWAASIINAIRMYSVEDSEVLLFGKILRNEIEEEAISVISRLKKTIADLLTYLLKSKNPLKSSSEIKELCSSKINGNLTEEEWKSIIYCVYEKEDAKLLEMKIYDHVKRKYIDNQKVDNINKYILLI